MPLVLPDNLPAIETLTKENTFVMTESNAVHQDIRPLKILFLNIMPLKIATEKHILRLLSNTPIQIEIDFLRVSSYDSKHTPKDHLGKFYNTFEQIKDKKYDGFIVTGAPVEQMEFEDVAYWSELQTILDWANDNVVSTLFICWAVQAGLYHHFNIPKHPLKEKLFGVFKHTLNNTNLALIRGFDDVFWAPHSRHTETRKEDVIKVPDLEIISESDEAGIYLMIYKGGQKIFITGHAEYDPQTLKEEYERDIEKGLKIDLPKNYFRDNNPNLEPEVKWRSHANLLFSNWINYYVYQRTTYIL
ncbi:MAG: homoserine O-succinyltransferase [Candidatus Margulisbacteria bacterium GWF2_35_9]|nr:MAG: homoserine O-succinyltransferase [Candidatus Margulisbacteria bacterium GWF2_35_9]